MTKKHPTVLSLSFSPTNPRPHGWIQGEFPSKTHKHHHEQCEYFNLKTGEIHWPLCSNMAISNGNHEKNPWLLQIPSNLWMLLKNFAAQEKINKKNISLIKAKSTDKTWGFSLLAQVASSKFDGGKLCNVVGEKDPYCCDLPRFYKI